jgi:hypothetical protein
VVSDVPDRRYEDIESLERIDELVVEMEFGLESHAYQFVPRARSDVVVLYHQGHDGDFFIGKQQIEEFLDAGYTVIGFCMPLFGLNNQPTVELPRFGKLKMWDHDPMKFLTPEQGHPIKYFIEQWWSSESSEKQFPQHLGGDGRIVRRRMDDDPRHSNRRENQPGFSGRRLLSVLFALQLPAGHRATNRRALVATGPPTTWALRARRIWIRKKTVQIINKYDSCCFAGTVANVQRRGDRAFELGAGDFDCSWTPVIKTRHLGGDGRILDELAGPVKLRSRGFAAALSPRPVRNHQRDYLEARKRCAFAPQELGVIAQDAGDPAGDQLPGQNRSRPT